MELEYWVPYALAQPDLFQGAHMDCLPFIEFHPRRDAGRMLSGAHLNNRSACQSHTAHWLS